MLIAIVVLWKNKTMVNNIKIQLIKINNKIVIKIIKIINKIMKIQKYVQMIVKIATQLIKMVLKKEKENLQHKLKY
jgi:hypothetical protein